MEAIKLEGYVDQQGVLRLELPPSLAQRHVEVVVLLLDDEPVDTMGYPIGYFEETYGITADDPIERGEQPPYDLRDEFE
jgi:hypothetical protein